MKHRKTTKKQYNFLHINPLIHKFTEYLSIKMNFDGVSLDESRAALCAAVVLRTLVMDETAPIADAWARGVRLEERWV